MRNIRLLIAFDGTGYNGWQRQKHGRTVQGEIETRLSLLTDGEISLHGAGRTDAGVHAEGMVAHFQTASRISCTALFQGLNSMLPGSVRIREVCEAPPDFHARFSARGKHYLYRLNTGPVQMPAERLYALHVPAPLDEIAVQACLAILTGIHDFASFENVGSRDKSLTSGRGSVRTIFTAGMHKTAEPGYVFSFIGDGFLRQMVRNLMGTLLEVGRNKRTVENFQEVLKSRDRTAAGPTAPAHGLTLKEVFY